LFLNLNLEAFPPHTHTLSRIDFRLATQTHKQTYKHNKQHKLISSRATQERLEARACAECPRMKQLIEDLESRVFVAESELSAERRRGRDTARVLEEALGAGGAAAPHDAAAALAARVGQLESTIASMRSRHAEEVALLSATEEKYAIQKARLVVAQSDARAESECTQLRRTCDDLARKLAESERARLMTLGAMRADEADEYVFMFFFFVLCCVVLCCVVLCCVVLCCVVLCCVVLC
jgi:predicted  nucleic acid-binding Zn-ribbon protein